MTSCMMTLVAHQRAELSADVFNDTPARLCLCMHALYVMHLQLYTL
jgi:hypothetical protein